ERHRDVDVVAAQGTAVAEADLVVLGTVGRLVLRVGQARTAAAGTAAEQRADAVAADVRRGGDRQADVVAAQGTAVERGHLLAAALAVASVAHHVLGGVSSSGL